MKIQAALGQAMKHDRGIRRASWPAGWEVSMGDDPDFDHSLFLVVPGNGARMNTCAFEVADMLADDWELGQLTFYTETSPRPKDLPAVRKVRNTTGLCTLCGKNPPDRPGMA